MRRGASRPAGAGVGDPLAHLSVLSELGDVAGAALVDVITTNEDAWAGGRTRPTPTERASLRTTAPEIAAAYQRSVLGGGDVVVSIGPAYGKVAIVSDDLAGGNLTQDTVRVALRPDLAATRFVVWALLSRQTANYWDREIMGATFRRLNLGTLAKTPIPFPSICEQRRIAAYLDNQTAKIDTLIAETELFIELSKERRSALITAAVTGQIDVREMA